MGLRFCCNFERAVASLRTVGVTKRDFGRSLFVAAIGNARVWVVIGWGTGATLWGVSKKNDDELTADGIVFVGVTCVWWKVLNIEKKLIIFY